MMSFTAGVLRKLAAPIIAQGQEGSARPALPRLPGLLTTPTWKAQPSTPRARATRASTSRVRSLPADTIALWAFVGAARSSRVVGFFVRVTYPNYDSYYSLIWGREVVHGHLPSFEAYRAPTEHPLAVAFGAGAVAASDTTPTADGAVHDASRSSRSRRARTGSGGSASRRSSARSPPFLVLTRFDFPSLAVRGYIDIPFMATIVWAGALEAARPRRGLPCSCCSPRRA